jgi:hypothetical protein
MVANYVNAYFHGHDHQYVYETRDGIVYQEVPSPSMTGSGFSGIYTEGNHGTYNTIRILPNSGYLRITVAPAQATVEYVSSGNGSANGTVNYTYTIVSNNPTAVSLSSFDASASSGPASILVLAWTTASEVNTAGFNIYRSERADGPYVRINPRLIPTNAEQLSGGKYQYEDTDVVPGKTYYYQLEDIELNGTSTRRTPIAVTVSNTSGVDTGLALGAGLGVGVLLLVGAGAFVVRRNRRA